jgi:hypothetical protein
MRFAPNIRVHKACITGNRKLWRRVGEVAASAQGFQFYFPGVLFIFVQASGIPASHAFWKSMCA